MADTQHRTRTGWTLLGAVGVPLLIAVGAFAGANLRYALGLHLPGPSGTLVANVLGSVALGLLTFSGVGGAAILLAGVGACGSYTTFSSFAYDTVRLVEAGHPRRGAANAVGTLLSALAGVGLAWLLVA